MICLICYDNNIDINNNCKICNNSVCNDCFCNILLYDSNFKICLIYNIPIIYTCSFCKCQNRIKNLNDAIQKKLIYLLDQNILNKYKLISNL